MNDNTVGVTRRENAVWLTINRPEIHNALDAPTYDALIKAVRAAAEEDSVVAIVFTGAGERAFSAGGDINEQARRDTREGRRHVTRLLQLAHLVRTCGKTTIAAVNGYAFGAGNELHLLCDLTIAAENAVFGENGTRVGTAPVWGATQLLPRVVGEKRAREIVLLGRSLTAQEACELGLVNKVVPPEALVAEVDDWCRTLGGKSPQALRIAKTSLNFESDMLQSSLTHGLELMSLVYGNEEFREGVTAFLEKRDPDYSRFWGS